MADTGGIDPEQAARLRAGYTGVAETGGFDPNTTSNLKSFYGGMRTTGGYSPEDVSNIRGRSNAGIPAVYSRLRENLRQAQARSGTSGYQATLAKLGRGAAQDAATTARDTEAEIADRLRSGRLTGAAGEFGLANAISANKLRGLAGGQGLEESLRSGRVYGLQGLGGLAGEDLAQQQFFDKSKFANQQAVDAAIQGTYNPDLSLSTRPGVGSNILKGLGVAASFASPFLGGFNPFGGGVPGFSDTLGPGAPELPEYKYPGMGGA